MGVLRSQLQQLDGSNFAGVRLYATNSILASKASGPLSPISPVPILLSWFTSCDQVVAFQANLLLSPVTVVLLDE